MDRTSSTTRRLGPMALLSLAVALLTLGSVGAAAAASYEFPSTNAENATAGLPHVREVSSAPGAVTLEFVNETNSLAFFEYRIDGVVQTDGSPHPVVMGDVIYPGVCVDGRMTDPAPGCAVGSVQQTFGATQVVEVRLALGGERDWDFDWTPFPVASVTKDSCKKGGWIVLGFPNQGQCIKAAKA